MIALRKKKPSTTEDTKETQKGSHFSPATSLFLSVLFGSLLLDGCAVKKPARPGQANAAIPIHCVTEARATNHLVCVDAPNDPGWAVCNGLAVKYECVNYIKDPK